MHKSLAVVLTTLGLLAAGAARAEDDPLRFLHALEKKGFADIAVTYLRGLPSQPDAPKEIMEVWDLEMSESLRAAAETAYSEADADRDLAESKMHLEKFIKENPKKPVAIRAAARWADDSGKEALKDLAQASFLTDPKEKAAALEKVRKILLELRPRYVQAGEAIVQSIKALPRGVARRKRDELEADAAENRLNVAVTDFYIAQTYQEDKENPERARYLTRAAKTFEDVFQSERSTLLGVNAHYFTARVEVEEGKFGDARDIFEEVLAADPTDVPDPVGDATQAARKAQNSRAKTGMEDFFAEVERWYLQCLRKTSWKEYLRESTTWRTAHKTNSEKTNGFQALSYELAQTLLAESGKSKNAATKKLYTTNAVGILADMSKISSAYQQDAIKLRRQIDPKGGGSEGFEEYVVFGGGFAQGKEWDKAIEQFESAIDSEAKATKKTIEKDRIEEVRRMIAGCYFNKAREDFVKNRYEPAAATLRKVLKDYFDTPLAPPAAEMLLSVVGAEYATAPEDGDAAKKAELLKQLNSIADKIIEEWPGKPEADAARLAKIRSIIAQEKPELMEQVGPILLRMNVKSENYGTALYLTSFTYWRNYNLLKRDLDGSSAGVKPPQDKIAERDLDRKKAIAGIMKTIEVLKDMPSPNGKPPKILLDSQILYSEMMLEGADPKSAAGMLQPLVDAVQKNQDTAQTLDANTLRVFNDAVQSYLSLNEMDKAGDVAKTLVKLGPDDQHVNISLMNFARRLDSDRVKLIAQAEQADISPDASKFRENADAYGKLLEDILTNLADRKQISPKGFVWIAQTCTEIRLGSIAEKLIKKIFDMADNDDKVAAEVKTYEPKLRTILISIQRETGKYQEAFDQVQLLIKDRPNALEPQMECGQILQRWAEKNPEKYKEAIGTWEVLRRRLEKAPGTSTGIPGGGKMKEYYDVTYNEALCCYLWAKKKANEKKDAMDGLQLLKPILQFDPMFRNAKLKDPELTRRFVSLSDKLEILLGFEPSSKKKAVSAETTASAEK